TMRAGRPPRRLGAPPPAEAAGPCRGAGGRTGASLGRAPPRGRDLGQPSPAHRAGADAPDPDAWIRPRHGSWPEQPRRSALNVCRAAAPPPSRDLTGTPCGDEPAVSKGRRGGTDEFLGRGISVPQSPWSKGHSGRPLDKCLVQLHASTVARKSHAAVSK